MLQYSSQYGKDRYSYGACNVEGAPDFYPSYGDDGHAWAPENTNKGNVRVPHDFFLCINLNQLEPRYLVHIYKYLLFNRISIFIFFIGIAYFFGGNIIVHLFLQEFLVVQYTTPVLPVRVDVYETCNPGALARISALTVSGTWVELWSGIPAQAEQKSRIFSPPLYSCDQPITQLRLDMDTSGWPSWYEVDAIGLVGIPKALQGVQPQYATIPPVQQQPWQQPPMQVPVDHRERDIIQQLQEKVAALELALRSEQGSLKTLLSLR